MCPGWELCKDDDQYCADWAAKGECKANPVYMLVSCRRACSTCPERTRVDDDALGIVGIDVRAGRFVDAVSFSFVPCAVVGAVVGLAGAAELEPPDAVHSSRFIRWWSKPSSRFIRW